MDPATLRLKQLIAPLTNYERTRPDAQRWSLAGMAGILARGECAVPPGLSIQVAGSKGKGTTTLYLEALARSAGLTTGAYLSPHVQSILERVRLHGRNVHEATLLAGLTPVLQGERAKAGELSFFEAMTAAAANCFASARVDLSIFEVGLGGRLDATTVLPVQASIVTQVELEHTELLGDTVAKIAAEKAHVIRPGGLAFTAAQGEALAVLRERSRAVGAQLHELGGAFGLEQVETEGDRLVGAVHLLRGRRRFRIEGACLHELQAFALAYACLATLAPELWIPLDPVTRPELPGRFERFDLAGAPLILDGAHTEQSCAVVARELQRRWPGQRVTLLFASAKGKRWREGLQALLPLTKRILVTTIDGTTAEDPEQLSAWLRLRGQSVEVVADAAAGLERLAQCPGLRLACGSFYLVGALRELLKK